MAADGNLHSQDPGLPANRDVAGSGRAAKVDFRVATWIAVAGILIVLAVHFSTVAFMVTKWADTETYQHGFIIVPIVAFLVWRKRFELVGERVHPDVLGLVFLLGCSLVWALGYLGRVHVVQQYAVVAMIPAIVWSVLGRGAAWKLKFPLAYLFFAVPAGSVFIPHLMDFTAHFTVWALRLTGVPVFSDGYTFSVPAGNFVIARACSGIRYLIASLALGILYAYLTYVSNWRRLFFVVLSALVPIVANGLRAYGIVMIAELIDVKYAHGIDHIIYGWIFFGFVMLLMFWVGNFFREDRAPTNSGSSAQEVTSPLADERGPTLLYLSGIALVSVILVVSVQMATLGLSRQSVRAEMGFAPSLARGVEGWSGPTTLPANVWEPGFRRADKRLAGTYEKEGTRVDVNADYFSRRLGGAAAAAAVNALVDDKHWFLSASRSRVVLLPGLRELKVVESQIFSHEHGRWLVWQWYDVGGSQTASAVIDRVLAAWQALQGKAAGTLVITMSARYVDHPETARRALADYLRTNFSAMNRCLSEPGRSATQCGQ